MNGRVLYVFRPMYRTKGLIEVHFARVSCLTFASLQIVFLFVSAFLLQSHIEQKVLNFFTFEKTIWTVGGAHCTVSHS